jgi:single-strand DNA-binding protein
LDGGVTVASFPLATTESFRDKNSGEKREQTEWHNIVMWRSLAESVEKSELKKGDRVYLEGKIRTRKWEKDGQQRFTVEIVADTFTIINRKRDSKNGEDNGASQEAPAVESAGSSDMPF